jgi:hypothetical protein
MPSIIMKKVDIKSHCFGQWQDDELCKECFFDKQCKAKATREAPEGE